MVHVHHSSSALIKIVDLLKIKTANWFLSILILHKSLRISPDYVVCQTFTQLVLCDVKKHSEMSFNIVLTSERYGEGNVYNASGENTN